MYMTVGHHPARMKPTLVAVLARHLRARRVQPRRRASATANATVQPAPVRGTDWPLPVTRAAAQPDLVVAPDGRLLLSWVAPQDHRAMH